MKVTNFKASSISGNFFDKQNRLELILIFPDSGTPFEMESKLKGQNVELHLKKRIASNFCDIEVTFNDESMKAEAVYYEPTEIASIPNPLPENIDIQLMYAQIIDKKVYAFSIGSDSPNASSVNLHSLVSSFVISTP